MNGLTIQCVECGAEFELTDSLAAPLLESAEADYKKKLAAKDRELEKSKQEMARRRKDLEQAEANLDSVIASKLASEKAAIVAAEEKKARAQVQSEIADQKAANTEVQRLLKETQQKLSESRKAEADFLKKQRDLENEKNAMELTVQTRVNKELAASQESLRKAVEAEAKLEVREKEIQLEQMRSEIASLKRKVEQGSQQLQGEVYEQEITAALSEKFSRDLITRVGKGVFGGDCVQEVFNAQNQSCGKILWESKRTQHWSDGWIAKLKGDQRTSKADVAIIVSQALPKGIETFDQLDGVWVASMSCLLPVAGSIRNLLIEIAKTRRANEGHQDKATLIYNYVTSNAFRHRVQAISETFSEMQEDLRKEQTAIKKQWSKRETQLERMLDTTVGLYGDFQGIAGKEVPEIEGMGLDALGAGE